MAARALRSWEVSIDKLGNTRLGVAFGMDKMSLSKSLDSTQLRGHVWFVDYLGRFKHNAEGKVHTIAQLQDPLATGDSVAFLLDLRPAAGGRLSIRHNGRSQLMVADLPNSAEDLAERPYLPVFNLDNIGPCKPNKLEHLFCVLQDFNTGTPAHVAAV